MLHAASSPRITSRPTFRRQLAYMVEDSAASVVLATEQHAEAMEPIARSAGAAFQVPQTTSRGQKVFQTINSTPRRWSPLRALPAQRCRRGKLTATLQLPTKASRQHASVLATEQHAGVDHSCGNLRAVFGHAVQM